VRLGTRLQQLCCHMGLPGAAPAENDWDQTERSMNADDSVEEMSLSQGEACSSLLGFSV
jgi:hypothetical protein